MNESLPHAIRRRWRNIRNARKGIAVWTDEHGRTYRGPEVDAYLDKAIAEDGPLKPARLERLMQYLERTTR